MIDSHPRIAVSHESEWMVPMGRRRADYLRTGGFDADRFAADLLTHSWAERVGLSESESRRAITTAGPRTFTDAVRAVFDAYATKRGKPRAGDKTPSYVIHMDLLAGLLPEGRFVHIVRDGRDVAMSYMDVPFGPKDMAEAAVFWRRRVGAGRASGRRLGPGRYLEVWYEELVDQPEDILRRACAFLDLEFDPAMLRYHERAEKILSSIPDQNRRLHANLSRPPTKRVRDWRREMSPRQLAAFEIVAGDLLEELGYERGARRASLGIRAATRLRTLRLEAQRRGWLRHSGRSRRDASPLLETMHGRATRSSRDE